MKKITISKKKAQEYIAKANVSPERASKMIGASHDYLGKAFRVSAHGMVEISERFFNEFCRVFDADPSDLCTRPYNRKQSDKCEQLEFEWEDEPSPIEISDEPPAEFVSVEADMVNGLKDLIHQARLTLQIIETALGGI